MADRGLSERDQKCFFLVGESSTGAACFGFGVNIWVLPSDDEISSFGRCRVIGSDAGTRGGSGGCAGVRATGTGIFDGVDGGGWSSGIGSFAIFSLRATVKLSGFDSRANIFRFFGCSVAGTGGSSAGASVLTWRSSGYTRQL